VSTTIDRYRGFYGGLVRRPVMLLVVFLALLVIGIISYMRIPVQMMPDGFVEPGLQVFVSNPGASAQENEDKVTRVLEEQIRTLTGVEQIESGSNDDNVWVWIQFDANTDMELAKAEVRDRLERARPQLPSTVDELGVFSFSNENMPGAVLRRDASRRQPAHRLPDGHRGRAAPQGRRRRRQARHLGRARRLDAHRARRGQGARCAARSGLADRAPVARQLRAAAGRGRDGGQRVLLRSDMRFHDAEEIASYPIGGGLTIGDVGRVLPMKSVRNRLFKIDGSYAYYGEVQKDSQANVVETAARLRDAFKELEADPRLAGEFKFLVLFDQGKFITSSLDQLRDAALWGGGLAVVVLFLFLRRIRSTLAVIAAIPFSILLAVAWIHLGGGTLNVLTMAGITFAMGMLVDDAVVVIENIARVSELEGRTLDSAARGTREVALAVVLSTLTTVIVFLPLIFITDTPWLRVVFAELGTPLCLSLMFSLVAALVFLPVIAARVVSKRPPFVQRIASALEPIAAFPARTIAVSVGAVRLAAFTFARALHPILRGIATLALHLRWVLAAALVAVTAWNGWRAYGAFQLGKRATADFGWSRSGSVDLFLANVLEVAALPLALAIVLIVVPRFARRTASAPVRPRELVSRRRSVIEYMIDTNHWLLDWTIRHRFAASILAVLVVASVVWPCTHMTVGAFGEDDNTSRLSVQVDLEENFTLAESEHEMSYYEDFFQARKDRFHFDHLANRFDPRSGRISLYWDKALPRDQYNEVEREVRETLVARPGHRVRLARDEGANVDRSKTMVSFRLVGPDSEELEHLGELAVAELEKIPGLSGVTVPDTAAQSQVRVALDSDLAQGFGISPQTALQNIAWALRGWQLPRYQEEGREIPLIIEYDDEQVAGLETLKDLDVFTGSSTVPLSSFAQFSFARGTRSIHRRNGQTSFTIEARVDDPLRQKELSDAGYTLLKGLDLPRGYSVGEEDLVSSRQQEEFGQILFALGLALVLAYIVMAILFESFLLPFAVMFTVPYGIVGSLWTLYVTQTAMDSVGWIGMVILVGVVVKNGIVLIDCIQRLRDEGVERAQAVLQGSAMRVRPVLMTAIATVMGLIPMALQEPASEGIDYRALATWRRGRIGRVDHLHAVGRAARVRRVRRPDARAGGAGTPGVRSLRTAQGRDRGAVSAALRVQCSLDFRPAA
jgi:multidrug efflux pump subunit AcrB